MQGPEQFKAQENFPPQTEALAQSEKITDLPNNVLALADTPEEASNVLAQKADEKRDTILKPKLEQFGYS